MHILNKNLQLFILLVLVLSSCVSSRYKHLGSGSYTSLSLQGVDNTGIIDVTKLVQEIVNRFDTVFIDSGLYKVQSIKLPEGSTIIGQGPSSKFIQDKRVYELPVFWVTESNVSVGNISIAGRIANQTSEFNHAISVQSIVNNIHNVTLKNIVAKNMRGDGIYIGSRNRRYNCYDVTVKNITTENCYRNGISITSGENIMIDSVITKHSGLYGIDIEGDPIAIPIKNIAISNINVGRVGIIGGGDKAEKITFHNSTIDGKLLGSRPSYKNQPIRKPGVLIMGASDIKFTKTHITNTDSYAIGSTIVKNHGQSDNIHFVNTSVDLIGLGDNPEKAIFYVGGISDLHVDQLKSSVVAQDVEYFVGNDKYNIKKTVYAKNMDLQGGILSRYCTVVGENIKHSTQEYCLGNLYQGSRFTNCVFSGQFINQNSPKVEYANCTFSYTRQKFNNCKEAIELNSKEKIYKR